MFFKCITFLLRSPRWFHYPLKYDMFGLFKYLLCCPCFSVFKILIKMQLHLYTKIISIFGRLISLTSQRVTTFSVELPWWHHCTMPLTILAVTGLSFLRTSCHKICYSTCGLDLCTDLCKNISSNFYKAVDWTTNRIAHSLLTCKKETDFFLCPLF